TAAHRDRQAQQVGAARGRARAAAREGVNTMFETLIHERIATVTMCRAPVNALSEERGNGCDRVLDELAARDDWTVVDSRATPRLTRLCGAGVASRMGLGAEVVDGLAARELGLVQWSVPRASIADEAATLARRIADLPSPALRAAKELIAAAGAASATGFALE